MLTRSRARATNQHVFVDDKWNDAYIQTKDEQIDMLHAQRVLKGWEDDADSEAEEAAANRELAGDDAEDDEDRWISEESDGDDDEDDEEAAAAKRAEAEALKQQRRRRRLHGGSVLAGGGLVENVLWTAMAATVAPVLLYGMAARVGLVGRKRGKAWPLQSASFAGTLVKAYANVATIVVLLGAAVWAVCGDVLLPLSLPYLRWRSLLRYARRVDSCAAGFVDDWQDVWAGRAQLPLLLLNHETQRLLTHAALLLCVAVLLTQFYRLWLKSVVLLSTVGFVSVRVASHLRAEQRSAIEIVSLDPNFAFANESIFIAIDGQNLEQGATVAWVPYWGVLQHLQAFECDKLFAQPLRNGGVRVAFDQLNEFVPCYAARGDDDDFKCFEHLRLRVKDQKSVPGWSLHASPTRASDEL